MEFLSEFEMAGPDIFSAKETGGSREAYLAVPITLMVIAAIFVAIRLSSNFKTVGRLLFEDYVAAIGVVFFAATFALSDIGLAEYSQMEYSDPETSTVNSATVYDRSVALFILSAVSTITSKAPILFLYIRLFGSQRWLRWCSYGTLLVLTIPQLAGVIAVSAVCGKHGNDPSMDCLELWDEAWVACGALSLAVDVIILLIPIPVILKLRLPVRKRLGLALVFASGIFAIGATAVALFYKIRSLLKGVSSNWTVGMFWSTLEWCIAVIVGCVPPFYTFWSTVVTRSTLYSKVSKTLSSITSSFSKHQASHGPSASTDSTHRITEPDPSRDGVSIEMSQTNSARYCR